MQRVLSTSEGAFVVHIHDHEGFPGLSSIDQSELRPLMLSIRNASPENVHGLLVLSRDAACAEALLPKTSRFRSVERIVVCGFPLKSLAADRERESEMATRFSRQSFLGACAEPQIAAYRVGIVGLGGGGSHIAQQLAHVGFSKFCLFDGDVVEDSNLNRLVGATKEDVRFATPKVIVAARLIEGVNPRASTNAVKFRWQDSPDDLRSCDVVIGCVDSYAERRDIEIACRRYLTPYIDIGLDVHQCGDEPPRMAGQVILSMPDELCMSCMGFLTGTNLAREAERYGAAGPRAQVIWANGVLASTAVGVVIDLITDWTRSLRGPVYLSYDSNTGTIQTHKRLQYLATLKCAHFPPAQVGQPTFQKL
jgi:hypothetical protein